MTQSIDSQSVGTRSIDTQSVDLPSLLAPYLQGLALSSGLQAQLSTYLDLLLRWNARTNLTAIRDPQAIVTRHFGESLFAAALLPLGTESLLDLGSGAGFPGLPLQLLHPQLHVTLAESQKKKATFLREVVRTLNLPTQVHAARAELLPPACFDCVTLRAVDDMPAAFAVARRLTRGPILTLVSQADLLTLASGLRIVRQQQLPESSTVAALLEM